MVQFNGREREEWQEFATKLLAMGAEKGGWDKALEMQLDLEVAVNKKLNKMAWCYLTLMLEGDALEKMDEIPEDKNAHVVWLHLKREYKPSDEKVYEIKLEQRIAVHTVNDQKVQMEQAKESIGKQQEKGSYCYIDLWEENEEVEKSEEFLFEPRQSYDAEEDVNADVEKDNQYMQVELKEEGTNEDVKDGEVCSFGEEESRQVEFQTVDAEAQMRKNGVTKIGSREKEENKKMAKTKVRDCKEEIPRTPGQASQHHKENNKWKEKRSFDFFIGYATGKKWKRVDKKGEKTKEERKRSAKRRKTERGDRKKVRKKG